MSTQFVTITFSPEVSNRTLADCLKQLLNNLNLETKGEESVLKKRKHGNLPLTVRMRSSTCVCPQLMGRRQSRTRYKTSAPFYRSGRKGMDSILCGSL